MQISTFTPALELFPRHAAWTGKRRINIPWRWWPRTAAALLSAQSSQWKSKSWMLMTTAQSLV